LGVEDLWVARRSGRFGISEYAKAWLISARLFAVPWVFLFTLFGAMLAGVSDWRSAIGACITSSLVLLASHFMNNYRDVELGVDRLVSDPDEARKIISSIKPYTAAAWVVPLGITSIGFQKANMMLCLIASAAVFASLVKVNVFNIIFYLVGVVTALTYTDFWKRKRLGEVSAFIGHGFSTTSFGFLSQSTDVVSAIIAGVVPGFISALIYSVDQYMDLKSDFVVRVRSIAESWSKSKLPLSVYVLAIIAFIYHMITSWVAMGVYPKGVLVTYALVPFILYVIPKLEFEREKALMEAALVCTFALPLLMCVGTLI